MDYIDAQTVREKLTTEFGQKAFDELNALGPELVYGGGTDGRVYLSPNIKTKSRGGSVLTSIGTWAKTPDDAVIAQLKKLKTKAEDGKLVVVNAYRKNRREYTYNPAKGGFSPIK